MMNLAVMSDLHVGAAARAKDLCPEPPTTPKKVRVRYDEKVDHEYRTKFIEFLKREDITADYLVLPGDLTNKAQPGEAELASEFILQAADGLGVPHDKIVFAPGNHDVDWLVLGADDATGVRWGQRYDPIGSDKFHFRNLVERGEGDVLSPPHFIVWTFDDLLVVSYNSASHDKPVREDEMHHGLADPDHLNAIRSHLEGLGSPDDRIRLFLVHHHPLNYSDPTPGTPDFSAMTNGEDLLAVLHEFRFDLFVHGHKHHPRFQTHSTLTFPRLPILCSGSFSVEIDTRWSGTIDNQFHLVAVEGRAGSEDRIRGTITSWAYKHCGGWIPSEESTSGIHHIIPFGNYVMPKELDAHLEPFANKRLAEHDCILWKHVVEEFPDLEHLPLDSAIAAFDRLAASLDCERMYETRKHLILFKKE